MTTIRSYTSPPEASVCASFLRANGFDVVLLDEASFQMNYSAMVIPIRLQVPEEQVAEAVTLLEAMRNKKEE